MLFHVRCSNMCQSTPFWRAYVCLTAEAEQFQCALQVLRESSAKQYQQIVLQKIRKNLMSSWLPILKLKGLLTPEISKFTKIRKLQKKLYANLRLLNDYRLIISIKTNKKAYVCVCFIFKLETLQARESAFPF